MTEWEWYGDTNTFKVFMHLLLTANHMPKKWKGITVEAGQKVTSIDHIANECGLTHRQTRTALNKLKATSEVTIKTTNKYSIVTIEKWGMYQSNDKQTTSKTTSNTSHERQTRDKQTTTNKNVKNVKNEKKKEKDLIVSDNPFLVFEEDLLK